jgi:hypothetical protein
MRATMEALPKRRYWTPSLSFPWMAVVLSIPAADRVPDPVRKRGNNMQRSDRPGARPRPRGRRRRHLLPWRADRSH